LSQDHEQPYAVRVWEAYRELSEQYQSPDVRIDALHAKLGGSLQDLHHWLRQACRDHLAIPSTGEPTLAGHAARQSALSLPGESETFLRIRLLEPSTMTQEHEHEPQPPIDDAPFGAEGLTAEQKLLNVANGLLQHTEVKRKQTLGRSDTYAGSLGQIALCARHLAEDVTAYLQQRERTPAEQYEYHLRQAAALKYPQAERTAEFTARIEKTIAKKVGEFTQERQAKQYEASLRRQLAERHPNLTPAQREHYEQRIAKLVTEYRQDQTQRQQQQAQAHPARSQEQGRAIER